MITGLDFATAKRMSERLRCRECGSGLLAPYGNSVRCLRDANHEGFVSPRATKVLSDGVEYDINTQKPVDQFEREGTMLQRQNPELAEVMAAPPAISSQPMTIEEFDQRMGLIKHVVTQMTEGTHYGVIPGTKDKSLWEPGAEYLRAAFNIAWSYEIIDQVEDYRTWNFRYTIRAFQLLGPGIEGPSWVASGSNRERKFWCTSDCPKPCDQDHEPSMEREMHPHNVRDRVLKRAFVGMIRNVTGTTGYFKEVVESDSAQERPAAQVRRQCSEHNKTFTRREKEGRVWYSHREGNGYCNAAKELVEEWERPDTDENTDGSGTDVGKPGGRVRRAKSSTAPQEEAPETGSGDDQDGSLYAAVLAEASERGLDKEAFLEKVINQKSWADFEKLGGNAEIAQKRLDAWVEKEQV